MTITTAPAPAPTLTLTPTPHNPDHKPNNPKTQPQPERRPGVWLASGKAAPHSETLPSRLPTATSLTALAGDLLATGDLTLAAALTELAQRRQLRSTKEVDSTKGVDSAKVMDGAARRQLWHPDGANPSPLPWGNRSGPTPDCVFDCDNWESELE